MMRLEGLVSRPFSRQHGKRREGVGKMMRILTVVAALGTASAAASVSVESATGDWKNLPQLDQKGYDHLSEKMQAKLFEIAEAKSCPSFLLNQGRLNFRIGFAVQYDGGGTLTRL